MSFPSQTRPTPQLEGKVAVVTGAGSGVARVDVKGVATGLGAGLPAMKQPGRGGAILNIASVASTIGIPDRFAYSMTKGAVLTMTYSVARDYVGHKIRCNAVSPGRVHT